MVSAVTAVRYERKWVPWGLSPAELLARVQRHPAGFHTAFPERQVNNIYYDTPGMAYYFDHLSGVKDRVKVRLRWYGEFEARQPGLVLEHKYKRGLTGWKESLALPGATLEGVLHPGHAVRSWMGTHLAALARERMLNLQPTVANCYRRHYFVSAITGIRLTVDHDLGFYGINSSLRAWRRLAHQAPPVVIELKYHEAQADAAADIAAGLPFRLTRFSKYVLGVQGL